jgi:Tol biopolymer transport system component
VYAEWLSDDEIVAVDTEGKVKSLKLSPSSDDKSLDDLELTVSTNGPNSVIVSPNKKYIALVNETQLSVFAVKDHQLMEVAQNEFTDIIGGIAWSPQSDSLAYVSSKSISIARIDDSQIVSNTLDFQEIIGFPSSLSWSPDSRFLLYQGFDGVWVVDVNSSERKLLIPNTPDSDAVFSTPSWSPGGKTVILESDGNIYAVDLVFDTDK